MIVQSFGSLQAVTPKTLVSVSPSSYSGGDDWSGVGEAYGGIYAEQPNIRIPVDELARNVAQIGIHIYRRVSDTDRERLFDHELARWLSKPNPATTQYRLIESLLGDLGVHFNAYWLKVRYQDDQNRKAVGLVRLPPEQITPKGGLMVDYFLWTGSSGKKLEIETSEIVYFGGYNPCNPLRGLSNLATLRRLIEEDEAAADHREHYWRNASRHEGVIERPREAPKWSPDQKKAFREQWQQRYASAANAGLIAVLEEGMTFKATAFSPKESEFIPGTKQRREVTAAQYHIPQPSVGILDHATFSNVREQHKQFYQDSVGPTLEMVQQEIERQLLPECEDRDNIYIEFNIAAKLQGSFEEQALALRSLVGRPIMTANEGRARLNLPAIKDDPSADQLAAQQGGPAATETPAEPPSPEAPPPAPDDTSETAMTRSLVASTMDATRVRQRTAMSKFPPDERSSAFFAQIDRWNRELAADLTPLLGAEEAARVAIQANVDLFTELEALEAV